MKNFRRLALTGIVGAMFLGTTGVAFAESTFVTGAASPITATAHLDFQITIPRVLYLRVGTGSAFGAANSTAVDIIKFGPSAANLGAGCGTPADCNAISGGDIAPGQVTASLISNVGAIKFSATSVAGTLNDGGSNTIPYSKILVASAATTGTLLTAPVWDAAAVTITPAANSTVNANAKWTFTFANDAIYPAGTYGGVNVQGGRVTYTATNP